MIHPRCRPRLPLFLFAAAGLLLASFAMAAQKGYYRDPTVGPDAVVFAAEGDLWTVARDGGLARRLTTHPGEESHPAISPDGTVLAFSATYEGPTEVYTMPISGGVPERQSWEAEPSRVVGWSPGGELLYATGHYSNLPSVMLVRLDLGTGERRRVPLAQASDGAFDASGEVLFFARPAFHNNNTKRYRGGTARNLWRFATGDDEATPLTADFDGEDHSPMVWRDRVYWVNDRDGTMNLWSADFEGRNLRQHTFHSGWDVKSPALGDGRIVYQLGADLWLLDLESGATRELEIELASDFDQLRERWVQEPLEYLTHWDLDPEGEALVLTARGRVFVMPTEGGRQVRLERKPGVRYRDAVFMPGTEEVLLLSDETGELEYRLLPRSGVGAGRALTDDGEILRFAAVPSPDGRFIAFTDLNRDLFVLEVASGERRQLNDLRQGVGGFSWSGDSRYLAWERRARNGYRQIYLYSSEDDQSLELTSDRIDSHSATWSPDGDWLYFLSDRHLVSSVSSPWGPRQPEPYFEHTAKIYLVALEEGLRPPFRPKDEMAKKEGVGSADEAEKKETGRGGASPEDEAEQPSTVAIDRDGLSSRIWEAPIEPGTYRGLATDGKALYWLSRDPGPEGRWHLVAAKISPDQHDREVVVENVRSYRLSLDRKRLAVQKGDGFYVFDAKPGKVSDLGEHRVDLSRWSFPISTREDFRQIFVDAWRLERDYFYDPDMHGIDWEGVRDKYLPLVDRVTSRDELSDLIGEVVGELSALHISVRGGDLREGSDDIELATLGARLRRDPAAGGEVIETIYQPDPDYPEWRSPLADPYLGISVGDVIVAINGTPTLTVPDPGVLLRNQQSRQVLLRVRPGDGGTDRDVVVVPIGNERALRYRDWENGRRLAVENLGGGEIGYVHLQAMGGRNLSEWYRNFYPVYDRKGLIIDVRHNRGGNIDSILLGKLLRKAWFYWQGRVGEPYWNMHYAFRGHMVVLINEFTASDGEAFAEGFRRLGLGRLIGTRTWGGEIWLSSNNRLSDGGIARAPQTGVYGEEREWLIEGWGVEPDIVVDNLPHETFHGRDRQLEAAVEHLQQLIRDDPREVPKPPPYPDKSFHYPRPTGGER